MNQYKVHFLISNFFILSNTSLQQFLSSSISYFFNKVLYCKSNYKYYKYLGSFLIPSSKYFTSVSFSPKLFSDKSNVKYYNLLGRYFIPSPNHYISSALSPKLLRDIINVKCFKLSGSYFKATNN